MNLILHAIKVLFRKNDIELNKIKESIRKENETVLNDLNEKYRNAISYIGTYTASSADIESMPVGSTVETEIDDPSFMFGSTQRNSSFVVSAGSGKYFKFTLLKTYMNDVVISDIFWQEYTTSNELYVAKLNIHTGKLTICRLA